MRNLTSSLITAVCVLALAGCTSPEPTAQDPTPAVTTTTEATTPAAPGSEAPATIMLPPTAWQGAGPDGAREDTPGVVAWRVPESCGAGSPADGSAMRTVTQGSGELESSVGVHQVLVLADADVAVAEANRLTAALTACAEQASADGGTYVVEPLAVGAQGIGLAVDYYGASAQGPLDEAIGTYLAITRRGNAVTLVAVDGGEGTVGTARQTVTANAQTAWELLCGYDSAGC